MFKNVKRSEESSSGQPTEGRVKTTKPGIADFDIASVEPSITKNNNIMLKVLFVEEKGASQFNHTFFITEKALPRLKSLWLDAGLSEEAFMNLGERTTDNISARYNAGETLTVEENNTLSDRVTSDFISGLVGTKVRLKVIGEIKDDTQNNRPEGYIVPTLAYAYFSEPVSVSPTKLVYSEKDNLDRRTKITTAAPTAGSGGDLPF